MPQFMTRRRSVLAAAFSPALFAAAASAQPTISETFDTGLNDWTFYADASSLTWDSTGGNPGGCARAVDRNTGVLWGFEAPTPFLGDKSCYYGGTLEWDVRTSHASQSYATRADLLIISPSLTLVYNVPGIPTVNTWMNQSATLSEADWFVGTVNGATPTAEEFQSVLANITALRFNCEWSASVDTGQIDNIILTAGPGCVPMCTGDFDGDLDTDSDDVIGFFAAWDSGDSAADADNDGDTDSDDIILFFNSWDSGC